MLEAQTTPAPSGTTKSAELRISCNSLSLLAIITISAFAVAIKCILSDFKKIEQIVKDVYESVCVCCQDMLIFSDKYMEKKNILKYDEYIRLPIHPRTRGGKPQLHTERVIFSHVSYLNHCRLYHINLATSLSAKKDINEMFTTYILKYLMLML